MRCIKCGGPLDTGGVCTVNCCTQDVHSPADLPPSCYLCSVCGGRGAVPFGFYGWHSDGWASAGTGTEQCKSCNGRGYVCE